MWKILLGVWAVVVVAVVLSGVAQHHRYHRTRRDVVFDRQEPFHASTALHVVTLLQLAPGQRLEEAVGSFVQATEQGGATTVYAGKVAVNALQSSQLPQTEWDAFVLSQYSSRDVYEFSAADPRLRDVRAKFASSYAMGMRRSAWLNLAIPIGLLGIHVVDLVTLRPSLQPFVPAAAEREGVTGIPVERRAKLVDALLSNIEYGKEAVVVLNLIANGDESQRDANSDYGYQMLRLMAEVGNGPMHLGTAETLEGDAEFDNVILVYYPGVEYFAEMVQSEFFTSIAGDKQLADTLALPTVPLLPHL
jgi:hypothetical protein